MAATDDAVLGRDWWRRYHDVPCLRCGHPASVHDCEDGNCETHRTDGGIGVCQCRMYYPADDERPKEGGMSERDGCELCQGKRGGVPGNENRIQGVLVCDYCHATLMRFRALARSREQEEPVAWLVEWDEHGYVTMADSERDDLEQYWRSRGKEVTVTPLIPDADRTE